MLSELRIRDFAIIDELDLALGPGLTVLTGETGAGKSIIVDAVALVLGGRADATVVRSGADRSLIEGVFRLGPARRDALAPLLAQEGLEGDEPDVLVVGREVRLSGRNVCRLNGRAVTLSLVRTAVEGLVDIHGQSEHLSLLRTTEQLRLLDRYAGTVPHRGKVGELVRSVREVQGELAHLLEHDQDLAQRADLLEFQIREIESAGLAESEEQEVLSERVRLANAEELAMLTAEALRALAQGGDEAPNAPDMLGAAVHALERLARVDPTLGPQLEAGLAINYQVEELTDNLRRYQDQIELNPKRLRAVEDRLLLIRQLERKYGQTVADVNEYAKRAAEELELISCSDERVGELRAEEVRLLAELGRQASALSAQRVGAAQRLAEAVEQELGDLKMGGSRFGVSFSWREDAAGVALAHRAPGGGCVVTGDGRESDRAWSGETPTTLVAFDASGIDRIEFLVAPNPGEPLKAVTRIASGGETSRLMLGLKSVLSRADETSTLIFDEIDQGIGGRVGTTVGEKLWGLTAIASNESAPRQVLCVTHLPQLAGFGDVHMHVIKRVVDGRTVTRVQLLDDAGRAGETVHMLGASGTAGRQSAEDMLADIAARKRQLLRSDRRGEESGS